MARTAKQAAASRRNLIKARRARRTPMGKALKNDLGPPMGKPLTGHPSGDLAELQRRILASGGTIINRVAPKKKTGTKIKGLPSMGSASAAKQRAFARKPKGASAQNAGSLAASRKRRG